MRRCEPLRGRENVGHFTVDLGIRLRLGVTLRFHGFMSGRLLFCCGSGDFAEALRRHLGGRGLSASGAASRTTPMADNGVFPQLVPHTSKARARGGRPPEKNNKTYRHTETHTTDIRARCLVKSGRPRYHTISTCWPKAPNPSPATTRPPERAGTLSDRFAVDLESIRGQVGPLLGRLTAGLGALLESGWVFHNTQVPACPPAAAARCRNPSPVW